LVVRQGSAVDALRRLIVESGADALYYQRDPDPFGKAVEHEVQRLCEELGVKGGGRRVPSNGVE
jgi:deoxyribodipyrimidine photo-lyase